jgi:hypothetical protein
MIGHPRATRTYVLYNRGRSGSDAGYSTSSAYQSYRVGERDRSPYGS